MTVVGTGGTVSALRRLAGHARENVIKATGTPRTSSTRTTGSTFICLRATGDPAAQATRRLDLRHRRWSIDAVGLNVERETFLAEPLRQPDTLLRGEGGQPAHPLSGNRGGAPTVHETQYTGRVDDVFDAIA